MSDCLGQNRKNSVMSHPSFPAHSPIRSGSRWPSATALVLGTGLVFSAGAQSPTPSELAANAMATAPVRALMQARSVAATPSRTPNEHEAQLAQIRQAILDATLERPTRVLSSAWVDDKGALHESAHFHSEAQVRGVRVMSYLQDGEPQTTVSAEVLPRGWKPTKNSGSETSCAPAPRAWRLPLSVQTSPPTGFSGPQHYASQQLLHMAQQAWGDHMQRSVHWLPQSTLTQHDNPYLRALTGTDEPATSGWTAQWSLQPHAPSVPPAWTEKIPMMGEKSPAWRWTLSLRIGQRMGPSAPLQPHWEMEQVVSISPQAMAQNPSAWAQALQTELQSHMRAWVEQLDKRSACEPVQFHVQRQGGASLQLHAGQASGLRPGDRVLLMNASQVPSRMLEPGTAQHLALAQVVKVGPRRTELEQLAGPALPSQGPWLAMPL